MELRQLEVFTTIVKEGNFSRAAKKLYLTQPTVSAHIESLERECGIKLFERRNRQAVLTEAGANFYPYALDLLEMKEKAQESLVKFNQSMDSDISILASQTPGTYLLPRYTAPFYNKYPRASFTVSLLNTADVFEGILNYEADLGFVGAKPLEKKLIYHELEKDSLVLVAGTPWQAVLNDRTDENGKLRLDQLLDIPFIFRAEGSATREVLEKALKAKGREKGELKIRANLNSLEVVKQFVQEGVGVSFISQAAVQDRNLQAFEIEDLQPTRSFYLIYHKDRVFSPTCERFISQILKRE